MPSEEFPRFLTPDQAAELLPVFNADWIRKRLRSGELAGYRVGGRWLIDPADLNKFVRDHQTVPSRQPIRRRRRRRSISG